METPAKDPFIDSVRSNLGPMSQRPTRPDPVSVEITDNQYSARLGLRPGVPICDRERGDRILRDPALPRLRVRPLALSALRSVERFVETLRDRTHEREIAVGLFVVRPGHRYRLELRAARVDQLNDRRMR